MIGKYFLMLRIKRKHQHRVPEHLSICGTNHPELREPFPVGRAIVAIHIERELGAIDNCYPTVVVVRQITFVE